MLETKSLKKVYKTKKGVSVEALKGVSLRFPEKGMVFLLGKSGSGKSTLLNLLGGLDKYDDGEIIIRGVSSKDFKQSHFDSYRNTYVGFIFQEYNVLEEFSVGANIALAIELQGRKASDGEINEILKQVDLEGFGDRKPNELSGGQKQRVAIARALVKNPQIIMADEPTGALDSVTGRQILDTLRKLSENKLVIVVSHDREFAERYADRIIELADGNVINDIERTMEFENADNGDLNDNVTVQYEKCADEISFHKDTMIIPAGYHLTEADRIKINEYISSMDSSLNAKIEERKKGNFKQTNQDKIIKSKGEFKLIKSKLPAKNAFKIGAGGLKHKKIRLAITIMLSFVAFALFALADTMGNYNHVKTCTNSIVDSNIQYASTAKSVKVKMGEGYYWDDWSYALSQDEIKNLKKGTGVDFKGVYVPNMDLSMSNYGQNVKLTENEDGESNLYATSFSGFAEITSDDLKQMGYKLIAGDMPDGNKDEMLISKYVYETYEKAGYYPGKNHKNISEIKKCNDLIGKTLNIGDKEMKITGIIDTNVDMERYKAASESAATKTSAEKLKTYALTQELEGIKYYSPACLIMTGEGYVQKMIDEKLNYIRMENFYVNIWNNDSSIYGIGVTRLSDIDRTKITWLDGERKQLKNNEIVITSGSAEIKGKGTNFKETVEYLKNNPDYNLEYCRNTDDDFTTESGWKIVGVIDTDEKNEDLDGLTIVPDKLYEKGWDEKQGDYAYAVASMPKDKAGIEDLIKYCYTEKDDMRYKLQNPVTFELDSVNDILKVLSKVFFYMGIGFAVFATIMLSNFIATSISYKKQEIGILRAIGARSNDVFRIFFSESFIIAMINFVLSCIAAGAGTALINWAIRYRGEILITVLNFGPRQILLLFVLSIAVAAVASFIPVYKIASKKPIEAIRNR